MTLVAKSLAVVGLVAAAWAMPATAQAGAGVAAAKRAGTVGERYDGYMGFVVAPSDRLRKQVAAVNIRRRTLFIGLGARRGVTAETAGIAVGCELLARVGVGEAYQLADGTWRRRSAGEGAPRPSHCGTNRL